MTGIDDREFEQLVPTRPGHGIGAGGVGVFAMWSDGRQTYTLQWGDGARYGNLGFWLADWTDTVIMAVEALRTDRHKLDADLISRSLREIRSLRAALGAIEDALILAARSHAPDGEPILSWRRMALEMCVHHSTPEARYGRLAAGERPEWWQWLTLGIERMPGEHGDEHAGGVQ